MHVQSNPKLIIDAGEVFVLVLQEIKRKYGLSVENTRLEIMYDGEDFDGYMVELTPEEYIKVYQTNLEDKLEII